MLSSFTTMIRRPVVRITLPRGSLGPRVEPIEDTPPPEEVNTRDDTLTTYMGDLPNGYYWINAYTQLEFKEEGTTINLLTPRAKAAKRFLNTED